MYGSLPAWQSMPTLIIQSVHTFDMKVVLVGVGQAGGKVTQSIVEFDHETGFGAVREAQSEQEQRDPTETFQSEDLY